MLGPNRRLYRRLRGFRKAEDGATAVEFAFVAIPFFMLVFAIIELAIIFFVSSTMTHAVGTVARDIKTGSFQSCGGAAKFKEDVCSKMKGLANCSKNLRIDVISEPSFRTVTFEPLAAENKDDDGNPTDAPEGEWPAAPTAGGDPVVIRAAFYYKLALPPQLTRLESSPGTGVRLLSTTTAFRNEPFGAGQTCDET